VTSQKANAKGGAQARRTLMTTSRPN